MRQSAGQELAGFEVDDGPPAEAPEARRIAEPRQRADGKQLVRAFADLLGTLTLGGTG